MREILLTQGRVALVDDEDYAMLSHWSWGVSQGYAAAYNGGGRLRCRFISMHRLLMLPAPDLEVDHINGDRLDNRKRNLRVCDGYGNQRNRYSTRGSSRFQGVCWSVAARKWQAGIWLNGCQKYLGIFDCEHEAAAAYDVAASLHFGEFARLNFPLNSANDE